MTKPSKMRQLARDGGFLWVLVTMIPLASFVNIIGKLIPMDEHVIVSVQVPLVAIQLFGLFMMIRYWKEVSK